jgi:ABC-type uncharacterized transport system substrate-binding protein
MGLGLLLIALAGGVLLFSDRHNRRGAAAAPRRTRAALVQHASVKALDDGRRGLVEQLAARGYRDGDALDLVPYNAEGDIASANAIAKDVTSGDFDLLVTLSTPSLQTVAAANKAARQTRHVFGLVSDPFAAGVGIDSADHRRHPPYMTGYGSLQPVAQLLRTIPELRPECNRLGLVWNPAESNSFAQTQLARQVCQELGIELLEASAENAAAVQEAANALVARGAEALWVSGDITVMLSTTAVIRAAQSGRIPVFTSNPPSVLRGALLDLGADYVAIGRSVGDLAADVLDGKNPADVPVENLMRSVLLVNETALDNLKDRWTLPAALRERADGWISKTETRLPPGLDKL